MQYYLFKKRIVTGKKEQYYELIGTYNSLIEAETFREQITKQFQGKTSLKEYHSWEEWQDNEYPIKEEGTFKVKYIF